MDQVVLDLRGITGEADFGPLRDHESHVTWPIMMLHRAYIVKAAKRLDGVLVLMNMKASTR